MNKTVALFLALLMMLSFAACGTDQSDTENNYDEQYYDGEGDEQYYDGDGVDADSDDSYVGDDSQEQTYVSHQTEVPDGYIGIYTAEDLQNVSKNMRANYILMNDIDLSDVTFYPFEEYFSGIFNGNNYTISNYSSYAPMFMKIDGAGIWHLAMKNALIDRTYEPDGVYFDDEAPVGGIVGDMNLVGNANSIKYCTFEGTIKMYGGTDQSDAYTKVGGIAGRLCGDYSVISYCSFNGTIEVIDGYKYAIGGITGSSDDESEGINNCHSSGVIKACEKVDWIGGICGQQCCKISDCYSDIDIQADKCSGIGGIV